MTVIQGNGSMMSYNGVTEYPLKAVEMDEPPLGQVRDHFERSVHYNGLDSI
jgi:hypothetical protein